MRKGYTSFHNPPFISDLGVGEFANSGTRMHIRFVASEKGIGAYSLRPASRSRKLNRGAIVRITDSEVSYLTTALTDRKDGVSGKKEELYGPALPYSQDPKQSGKISVTASIEQVLISDRKSVDDVLLRREAKRAPMKFPFFWKYLDQLTNWLMVDSGPVFYRIFGETKTAYAELVSASQRLSNRGGCYIDHAERSIYGAESYKGNAGVSKLLDRKEMSVGPSNSLHFHLNFHPVTFGYGSGSIYFLPEELIIAEYSGACMFVPYSEISYRVNETTHAEVPVPSWCSPVSYTWLYMNKNGGPDRRYNNNVQIPHYKVWELDFSMPSGRIDTAFADEKALDQFTNALDQLITLSSNRKVAV